MADFSFPEQSGFYRGKVRDVYTISDRWLVMIASDRISAFDVILPRLIPHKGAVLNQIASHMLESTRDICPNWLLAVPAAHISVGKKCDPIKIEVVVRGILTGHAWRTYAAGKKVLCGVTMPPGLKENDHFHEPIITPSTKAAAGHDEDISKEEIIANGILSLHEWEKINGYALQLFKRGKELAMRRGLILADTKYEFGYDGDEICLMDEIHTPDSSRYFYASGYDERQAKGEKQKQLSKEFVREWLIAGGFMGKEGQNIPEMTAEWVDTISQRYIELYENLLGEKFKPEKISDTEIQKKVMASIKKLES